MLGLSTRTDTAHPGGGTAALNPASGSVLSTSAARGAAESTTVPIQITSRARTAPLIGAILTQLGGTLRRMPQIDPRLPHLRRDRTSTKLLSQRMRLTSVEMS
jgi:hypothetical protein